MTLPAHFATLAPGRFAYLVAGDGDSLPDIMTLERPVVVLKGRRTVLDLRAAGAGLA